MLTNRCLDEGSSLTDPLSLSLCVQDERHQQEEQHLLPVQEERQRQTEIDRDCCQTAEEPSQWHVLLNTHMDVVCA